MLTHEEQVARPSWEDLRCVSEMAAHKAIQQAFPPVGHEAFRVPNNWEGRLVRWILRRYLNRRVYKLVARGRKATDGKRHLYSIPLTAAGELAIYIYPKKGYEV